MHEVLQQSCEHVPMAAGPVTDGSTLQAGRLRLAAQESTRPGTGLRGLGSARRGSRVRQAAWRREEWEVVSANVGHPETVGFDSYRGPPAAQTEGLAERLKPESSV